MTELLSSYLPIVVFIGISLVIGAALLVAPFIIAFKAPDSEKLSAYECGFNAFDDARMKFDIRFYLVAALCWRFGPAVQKTIEKNLGLWTTAAFLLLVGGFALVKYLG